MYRRLYVFAQRFGQLCTWRRMVKDVWAAADDIQLPRFVLPVARSRGTLKEGSAQE